MHTLDLQPYQRRYVRAVADPRYLTAALSLPRGGGKTTLGGWLVARALSPGDSLYAGDGREVVLFSGSIEQCRLVYRQALKFLEPAADDYRTVDSATRVGITHKARRTRLKAIGSNPKTSLGLVDVPLVVLDEPGALHTTGGAALWDALRTAQGKVGSRLKIILIGTLAPALPGSWWPLLVERGTHGSTYVQCLQGRADRWSHWREVLRVNPLARTAPEMAAKLREELDEAKRDTRLAASFKSYRLNLPSGDESTMLLTVEDWERVTARPVPERDGAPIVGIDLGGGRAWSAAVALWTNGRIEALACAPGIPSLEAQEKRDRVPAGTYRALATNGALSVAEGLRVQPPGELWRAVVASWGRPARVICDRFRLAELRDAADPGVTILPRVTRWSDAASDIRAVRKLAADGPLSCEVGSRGLLTASLAAAMVRNDDQGNVRLAKRGTGNEARDDVAAALTLAAGSLARELAKPAPAFPDWFVA